MTPYLWVMLGSALGGLLRYGLGRWTAGVNDALPWTTIGINIAGSFAIGFYGTLTQPGTRFAASGNLRLFVMVGLCGGFTTFSSFSLQTFDLLRAGALTRALGNIGLSVVLCLAGVALGHRLAQAASPVRAIAETGVEEQAG